jgi:hypothetical protein
MGSFEMVLIQRGIYKLFPNDMAPVRIITLLYTKIT